MPPLYERGRAHETSWRELAKPAGRPCEGGCLEHEHCHCHTKLGRTGLTLVSLGRQCTTWRYIDEVRRPAAIDTVSTAAQSVSHSSILRRTTARQRRAPHRQHFARRPSGSFVLSTKVGRLNEASAGGLHPHDLSSVACNSTSSTMIPTMPPGCLRIGYSASVCQPSTFSLIHDADAWSHGPEEGPKRYKEAMNGAYKALEKLRSEGTVKGASASALRSRLHGALSERRRISIASLWRAATRCWSRPRWPKKCRRSPRKRRSA